MVPQSFHDFFIASAGASAALIGLLFVAVSFAPGRIFGAQAIAPSRDAATSAFAALTNAFFVSLVGLEPNANIGQVSTILGAIALLETLAKVRRWALWKSEKRVARSVTLLLAGLVVYGSELWLGEQLLRTPTDTSALSSLLGSLLGMYAVGLLRSWELLGAQEHQSLALSLLSRLLPPDHTGAPTPQETEPPIAGDADPGPAHPDAPPAALSGETTALRKEPEEHSSY